MKPTQRVSDDIAETVRATHSKDALKQLIRGVRSAGANESLASELASYLQGGHRWFSSGHDHSDPIDAITSDGGAVIFTYRRDGKRPGVAHMSAHRIGAYGVLAGDWWQQSRRHGSKAPVPPIPLPTGGKTPSFDLPIGWLWKDDTGGCVYVFSGTSGLYRHVTGTGIDYGDKHTNPNWLTGGNGL